MFQWAQSTFDKLAQTVAPPPEDGVGRFVYCVQRGEEEAAMGCIAGMMNPNHTLVNATKGQYPIHLACQYSCQRLLLLLLHQPGMDIQQPDLAGNSPLHYASMSTAPDALNVVKLLITQWQASVLAKNAKGETPYDVATLNVIRQYLLPIQLQAETQIALDNGGQGLPPGIDLGGLRIQNPAMPPPPTFGGGGGGGPSGTVGGPPFGAASPLPSQTQMMGGPPPPTPGTHIPPSPAPPNVPMAHMFGTPSPTDRIGSAPAPSSGSALFSDPPLSHTGHRTVSSSSSSALYSQVTPAPSSSGKQEYSRVGSSSAALGVGKYRADGFHSSSSDVSLQKKYGHSSTSQYRTNVAPPPSSGNGSVGAALMAAASSSVSPDGGGGGGGGPNPFSALGTTNRYSALSSGRGRYVAYGQVAAPAPAVTGTQPYGASYSGGAPSSGNLTTFTPGGGVGAGAPSSGNVHTFTPSAGTVPTAPLSFGAPNVFASPTPMVVSPTTTIEGHTAANSSVSNTFMPPPPFHSQEYARFQTTSAQIADVNAEEIFAQPSPLKDSTAGSVRAAVAETPAPAAMADALVEQSLAPATDLPNDWVEALDPTSGQMYFYNSVTQETSWERPGASLPNDWVETTDPTSGQIYYYNSVTQETSWERPTGWTDTADPADPSVEPAPEAGFGNQDVSTFASVVEQAPTAFVSPSPADVAVQAVAPQPSPPFTLQGPSLSADELFSEDAPEEWETEPSPTITTTAEKPVLFVSPKRSMSAEEVFTEGPAEVGETDRTSPTTKTVSSLSAPYKRTLSADELFADTAPDEDEVSPPPLHVEEVGAELQNPPDMAANGGGDDEVTLPRTPVVAPVNEDCLLEEVPLSDIPLSPDLLPRNVGTDGSTMTTTTPLPADDSLFAAIGMPPPPFSTGRR